MKKICKRCNLEKNALINDSKSDFRYRDNYFYGTCRKCCAEVRREKRKNNNNPKIPKYQQLLKIGKKICKSCNQEKKISLNEDSEFHFNKSDKFFYGTCIQCDRKNKSNNNYLVYIAQDKEIAEAIVSFSKKCNANKTDTIRHILRWFFFGYTSEDILQAMKDENNIIQ